MEKDVKTQWHPAFCSAVRLELQEDAEYLDYTNEYNINSMPLQMDMLIIKKAKNVEIKNQIGKIFRGHNILEYKSPDDAMNLDTFMKVKGYACIYKANEEHIDDIMLDDITITLVRESKPKKLFRWFQENDYDIAEVYRGIYYVTKEKEFPVQILVSQRLSKKHQKWLTLLTRKMDKEDMKRAVHQTNALVHKDEKDQADSIMQVVLKENGEVFDSVKEDDSMCQALRELMGKEIHEEALKLAQELAKEEAQRLAKEEVQRLAKEEVQKEVQKKMYQLVQKNMISVEDAAAEFNLSVEEFLKKVNA